MKKTNIKTNAQTNIRTNTPTSPLVLAQYRSPSPLPSSPTDGTALTAQPSTLAHSIFLEWHRFGTEWLLGRPGVSPIPGVPAVFQATAVREIHNVSWVNVILALPTSERIATCEKRCRVHFCGTPPRVPCFSCCHQMADTPRVVHQLRHFEA